MKKNFKRTLAKVMAVALTVSMVGVASDDVDAAKKIKLSKKTVSVAKGKTKKVTIKNVKAKKVKKLTVKSANKKIATVKKAGKTAIKVTGKKAGKSTKVTVKVTVKGKKKATKLTLKVKVTKAKKASKSKTTAAPSASATPAASASASATPAASAAASKAPASNAPASKAPTSATPAPTAPVSATPEATATAPAPEKSYDPEKADLNVALTAEKVTKFSTSGEYGQVTFNEDGTVSFSSQPTTKEKDADGNETDKVKAVSVYNNGLGFFLGDTAEDQVDVSDYQYVSLRVKTDAEVKLMTWAGGDDANSFWDKTDTWGSVVQTVENADGSKTLVYEVKTAYGKKANKAKAIGLTLKSNKEGTTGNDEGDEEAKEGTLYSITFSNKIPEAVKPAEPTATPVIETIALDLTATSKTMKSDVTPADGVFPYAKQYQSAFFDIPEDINLAQVTKAVIKADVPNQLSFTLWNNTLDQKAESWWSKKSFTAFVTYPFYGGSCTARDEKGGFGGDKGEETLTYDIAPNWTVAGNGGYVSIGSNQKIEDGDVYKILSVELVIDHSKATIKDVVEPEVTPAPTASASAAPSTEPSVAPSTEPSAAPVVSAEPETKDPETSAAPTQKPSNESPKVETTDNESGDTESGDVTKPTKSPAPTEAPEAETPEINVALKNDNMFTCGDLIAVESGDVTKDVFSGTESEDGISFTTKNEHWGGGMAFYFNTDKSAVNLKDYKSIEVTLSATSDDGAKTPVGAMLFSGATADNYLYSKAYKWSDWADLKDAKADETTITFDLNKVKDAGDAYAFGIKYNGWVKADPGSAEEKAAKAKKATITIKSIKLIPAK